MNGHGSVWGAGSGPHSCHGEEGLSWLRGLPGSHTGTNQCKSLQGASEEEEPSVRRGYGEGPPGRPGGCWQGRGASRTETPGHWRLRWETRLELTWAGFPRSRSQMMAGTPERDIGEGRGGDPAPTPSSGQAATKVG